MSVLAGELLKPPDLRFNYSSTAARHPNPRRGLKAYGPYDASILGKDRIHAAVIFSPACRKEKDLLVNGLINGQDQFPGFGSLFRIPLIIDDEWPLRHETDRELQRVIRASVGPGIDLALIVAAARNDTFYRTAKRELLGNGIPNQVVTVAKLRNPGQVPWVLENVSLACYAKSGGTPWVVASDSTRRELVIGVSRVQDRTKKSVVGFVTMFTQDGDFLFLHSQGPVFGWDQDEYVRGLTGVIVEAYREYERNQGTPESLVLHLCKRPGRFREVLAAEQAIEQIGNNVPYALIHLNDDSSYRVFDTSHPTCIPDTGLKVDLSRRNALLLLDGRVGGRRFRRGVPRVLDISMDRRSTMSVEEFPRLVSQISHFARVNWRGFNAQAIPVTLNYSYLIARLIVEIGADGWSSIISAGQLRDKAWFL